MALFVAVLLISNIASSAKIVDWGVTLLVNRRWLRWRHAFSDQLHLGDVLTEVCFASAAASSGPDSRCPR